MYLKSIKAYGFKSFADKIEINFEKNINGIVGPNGSGKSNVVDAVRWVLGEQSLKSLRGDTSTDIIFSGSKSRKPLNSASVTLVFDNTDLYLPIQYTEVSVKRVMYRSGENEYYLNNEKCRLKDITNLLTDTGADKESFNIISQGKIDEILSTKPSDRRGVFESAAGVLKYKKRKEEASKKLERTNANLDRVNDIIQELENNLGPLERQSRDAKRFLEIKNVLTELEVSLMASDIHNLNYESKNTQEKINHLKDEIVSLSNTHSSYDIELLSKKDELKKLEEELNQNQSILMELTKNIEKINADVRLLKERKKYNEGNSAQANTLLTLKESLLKKETTLNEIKNNITELQEELTTQQESFNNRNQKYLKSIDSKNRLNQTMEQYDRNINQLNYKIEYLEKNIESDNSLPNSVKNILNNKRFTGVHNVIGKLMDMDKGYYTAISTALGGGANYLVVDTKEDAKRMVDFLKENKLGRATFFPLDTIKPRLIDPDSLKRLQKIEGFIGVASSLVKYQDIYQNIILNQLGNIIICNNLDSANHISKSVFNRYKVVTLDGQVVNVGGSITGGSAITTHNFIKDKYELESLKLERNTLSIELQDSTKRLEELTKNLNQENQNLLELKTIVHTIEDNILSKKNRQDELERERLDLEREIKDIEAIQGNQSDSELETLLNLYYSAIANRDNTQTKLETLRMKKENLEANINEIESLSKQDNYYINLKEKNLKELEIKYSNINIKLDHLLVTLGEEYNLTYEAATSKYKLEMEEELARERVRELKREVKEIGYVNVEAIDEYEKVKERYEFLTNQKNDLKEAESTLLNIMKEMDAIMKEKFITTFELIRSEFKKVFREMFKGGEAELILTEPDNLLETGIEIQAIPSGKNLKSITLLSGGEKTFTAISLLFAILNVRPVPFCLLDEVEAALDDANVESFGHYLDKYRDKTQFILITHKKKTMEFANTLYGITMQESGVSKLVSVRLEELANKES